MVPAQPRDPGTGWRRVLLLGFMAAGKSTVGPLLADALGWQFLDGDAELARRSGVSVAGWFRSRGEAAFRAAERRLTAELCTRERLVLAPGGGWAAGEGALEGLPPGTALVWLRVSAAEALRRAAADAEVRPLLVAPDPEVGPQPAPGDPEGHRYHGAEEPLARAERLLAAREPSYARADYTIDVDGRTPGELAAEILGWLRTSS